MPASTTTIVSTTVITSNKTSTRKTTTFTRNENSTNTDDGQIDDGGLGTAELIGITVGAVVGVALVTLTVLTVLKQRRVINIRIPVIDNLLNRSNDSDGLTPLTTRNATKYERNNDSVSLQNPAFKD